MDIRSRIWKPLNPSRREIRLLILSPDEEESALPRGRLITVSLEQQLYYDAISHAWGSPSDPQYIYINNVEWPVTTNVLAALRRVRHPAEQRSFWIDALCVNQYDAKERAEQVKLMQHIFNRAVNVQAWLGHYPGTIDPLIDDINDDTTLQGLFSSSKSDDELQKCVERISAFAGLDYWNRTWIIQELALARSVVFVFRRKTFTMERFIKLYDAVVKGEGIRTSGHQGRILQALYPIIRAGKLSRVATMGSLEQKARQLIFMLSSARLLGCSDARDRIYGMVGIMTAMFGPDFIDADYEWSLSDVYTSFAARLIHKTGSLVILNQAEEICPSTGGLPTWVPDWMSRFEHYDARRRLGYFYNYSAAGDYSSGRGRLAPIPMPSTTRRPYLLKCAGHIFGTVRETGAYRGSSRSPDVDRELKPLIQGWRKMHSGSPESFMRTITLSSSDNLADLEECCAPRTAKESETSKICLDATSDRRFFITDRKAPGLGPRDTRPGDFLAVLAGGRVAYVLRQTDSDLFSFVGECFVDGVMHGELFESPKPPELSTIYLE